MRTERRLTGRPYATFSLALLCTAALVRLAMLPAARAATVLDALGVIPARFLAAPWSPAQLVTLITASFLHAGWLHLAGNVLYLMVFGPTIELRLGWKRFIALFFAGGACGALAHVFTHPASLTPLVGASGAIAGVLGAHLVLDPRGRITSVIPVIVFFEIASLPAAFVIAFWFALQVASAVAPVAAQSGAQVVAWWAHIGGFAVGAMLALPARGTTARGGRSKSSSRARARR